MLLGSPEMEIIFLQFCSDSRDFDFTKSSWLKKMPDNSQRCNSIYMSLNNINPSIVWEFHEKKHVPYDLRKNNLCKLPRTKTTSYGVESLSFRGSFLWNILDDRVKQEPILACFKNKIKNWAGELCTCRICR